jgi:hypothetical protein
VSLNTAYLPHNRFAVILHGALRDEAEASAAAAAASHVPGYADGGVGVLFSTDYENLAPGYWVVWAIGGSTRTETAALAEQWRTRGYAGAYSRWLGEPRRY